MKSTYMIIFCFCESKIRIQYGMSIVSAMLNLFINSGVYQLYSARVEFSCLSTIYIGKKLLIIDIYIRLFIFLYI